MPTNEERREVARKLRELSHGYVTVGDYREAIGMDDRPNLEYDEVTGEPVLRKIDLDDTGAEMLRLADLIDPGDTSQTCRDNVACDRYALLSIVEEMESFADPDCIKCPMNSVCGDVSLCSELWVSSFAKRIHKALGEEQWKNLSHARSAGTRGLA